MKNKSLLPILIATFALTACALPSVKSSEAPVSEEPTSQVSSEEPVSSQEQPSSQAPSSQAPSSQAPSSQAPSSSEAPVNYGVTIDNKTAFAEWYAGTTRDLSITLTPAANVLQELNRKNLTVTSSDPETVKVQGVSLAALKAGTATITVAYHGVTDSLAVTIIDNSAKSKYGVAHEGTATDPFTNEEAILVTKSEKYEGEDYYVGGEIVSFYHAPGSRDDGVVSYYLKPAQNGGEKFEVYKCLKEDGSALTNDDIWVGGYAVAHGTFTTYGSQCETSSAKFLSCEGNKPEAQKTITATFAETFAVGAALADGDSTYDFYSFTGYVTKKSGNNFFLTATKGEEIVKGKSDAAHGERDYDTNAIELYFSAAPGADITAKLLQDAKVTVKMQLKNYHGEVENSNKLTADDITVVEAGQNWAVPEPAVTEVSLADFIAGENTKKKAYIVSAQIKAFKTGATKDDYGNMTVTDGTNDLIIYGASATATALAWDNAESYAFVNPKDFQTNEVTKDLAIGQTLKMKLIRADYTNSSTGVVTIEGTGIILEVSGEPEGPTEEIISDVTAVATVKTIAEVKAATAANNSLIAKVTGVAENNYGDAKYGNFYLVDPTTGDAIVVYGGYTEVTFAKTGDVYATKTKATPITADIIGKSVTVYATIGAYKNVGQLVDGLVVAGAAYTGDVATSINVAPDGTGSANLNCGATVAYGTEIEVFPVAAEGYQVAKVEVVRASKTEVIEAVDGHYKFNAQAKNDVIVTMEEKPAEGVEEKSIVITDANLLGYTGTTIGYPSDSTPVAATINEVGFAAVGCGAYGNGIQMRTKNGIISSVYNTTSLDIKKLEFVFDAAKDIPSGKPYHIWVEFSNDADFATLVGAKQEVSFSSDKKASATPEAAAKYFRVSHANQGAIYMASIKVVLNNGEAPAAEVAQPIGSFNGYATSSAGNVFVNIAIADSKAYVEIGTFAKDVYDFSFNKTTGVITVALGGQIGNLTAKYDETNNKLVECAVDGAAAAMLTNNGSLELTPAKIFADCNGTTEELQAMFKRRYNDPWTVDTNNADRFTSYADGICGSAMKVRAWTGGRYAVNFGADLATPIEVSNVGFWVYNSGATDVELRMWGYKDTGFNSNFETGRVTAKAGQWTYCRMGFTKAAIYNFQIADFTKTGTALVFDNICLF